MLGILGFKSGGGNVLRVFGYMRFSYAGRSDARASRAADSQEEVAKSIYEPVRMERRFFLFENICLPSIKAQTDQDFRIVVLASNIMPDIYKQRLQALVENTPQIEILYSDAAHVTDAFNPWLDSKTSSLSYHTAHFRLDDDDAISSGTIERLASASEIAPHVGIVSFPRGLNLSYKDGKALIIREYTPYIAIALAYLNAPGQVRNPYMGKHAELHKLDKSLLDPGPCAYIHTAHDSSDTLWRQTRRLRKIAEADPNFDTPEATRSINKMLRKEFPGFSAELLCKIIAQASHITSSDTTSNQ